MIDVRFDPFSCLGNLLLGSKVPDLNFIFQILNVKIRWNIENWKDFEKTQVLVDFFVLHSKGYRCSEAFFVKRNHVIYLLRKYLSGFINQNNNTLKYFLLWKSQILISDQLLHNQTNYYQEGSVKFIVTIIITSSVSLLMITPSSNMERRTIPQWTPLCNVYRWLNSGHCSLSYPNQLI